ncbi:MAG: alpha/beta fold hydrolase [Anaerolineales bacterium]|nr:alpha/beta fold hydrolase [Anaerolineales bacterium]
MYMLNLGIDILVTVALTAFLLLPIYLHNKRNQKQTMEETATPKKRILYVLRLSGFTLLAILVIAGGVLVYKDAQIIRQDTTPAPSQVSLPTDLPFIVEEIAFTGGDNLTLYGWFVPSENGATIILLHGSGGNRTSMLWQAKVLVEAGYGVLLYDERASGESEGDQRTYGWRDRYDVEGALEYLDKRPEVDPDRIGIAGCSIGGQIAIHSAAFNPQLAAVWADGPAGLNAKDAPPPDNWLTLLASVSNPILDQMLSQRTDTDIPPALIDIIGSIEPRPVMLVAGGNPHPLFGAESEYIAFYLDHAGEQAELWVIPEANHCDGPAKRPEAYASRMRSFFDQAFESRP